jgi:hypothetical protein
MTFERVLESKGFDRFCCDCWGPWSCCGRPPPTIRPLPLLSALPKCAFVVADVLASLWGLSTVALVLHPILLGFCAGAEDDDDEEEEEEEEAAGSVLLFCPIPAVRLLEESEGVIILGFADKYEHSSIE